MSTSVHKNVPIYCVTRQFSRVASLIFIYLVMFSLHPPSRSLDSFESYSGNNVIPWILWIPPHSHFVNPLFKPARVCGHHYWENAVRKCSFALHLSSIYTINISQTLFQLTITSLGEHLLFLTLKFYEFKETSLTPHHVCPHLHPRCMFFVFSLFFIFHHIR